MTAGAVFGSNLMIKSVGADDEDLSRNKTPFIEASLTYNGNLEDVLGVEVSCGEPNYWIHDSDLYLGDVDIRPYIEAEPLVMWNSSVAPTHKPLPDSRTDILPIEDNAGLKRRLKVGNQLELPEVSIKRADVESVVLSIDTQEVNVQEGYQEVIELESEKVEVEAPGDDLVVVDVSEPDSNTEEYIEEELPETTTVRQTRTKTVEVTPSIRLNHHGEASIYGSDDGVVLPKTDKNPLARRAMQVGDIDHSTTEIGSELESSSSTKEVILVHRGEN
ncbi:hypothetical protein GCM10009647_075090 [Streptomyces sanglieri]